MDKRIAGMLGLSAALMACTGGGGGGSHTGTAGATSASTGLPCDVDAVFTSVCQSCHGATPTYGAPMPLVTYADLQAPAVTDPSKKVYELVDTRVHDDAKPCK